MAGVVGSMKAIGGGALAAALVAPCLAFAQDDLRDAHRIFAKDGSYLVQAVQPMPLEFASPSQHQANGLIPGQVTILVSRGNSTQFGDSLADLGEALGVAKIFCARNGLGLSREPRLYTFEPKQDYNNAEYALLHLCFYQVDDTAPAQIDLDVISKMTGPSSAAKGGN